MTEENNKNGWFDRIYKFINPNEFLEIGKYIILLFGSLIIIERMIGFYITFDSTLKSSHIFTIIFMMAIASVIIYVCKIPLEEFLGEEND